ncbi:FMN-binding domain protein [Leptothrix cholodnii SP-6]|uniref:FMN-binding domain protein n=1 Tax=Leptothrix cholodnii (strain ATCC 51168 / LMG 8142 / SP-6) TaxID=395495 RepID=B1Y808_LEPCP|nr:NosR/NirI family protein [Leptothrix cholodnii]ACB33750.1 FMN-binding domain protein [Leptothrix cholodnii SP-6]
MKLLSRCRVALCAALLSLGLAGLIGFSGPAHAGAYEAHLPDDLATTPDLCARVACTEVLPGATTFSERKGQPPYVEGYTGEGAARKLVGYVMLSTDITDTPAYSGKPVVTLIGMDASGRFVGVKVLKHSEPILLLGIPEGALTKFNDQYLGKSVRDKIEVGPSRPDENVLGVDAISGATVTVIAQNQVLMTSANAVARQVGIVQPVVRDPARWARLTGPLDWAALVEMGAVQHLRVKPEQVGQPRGDVPFIELWFGDLNHPDIGRSLLGAAGFDKLQTQLKPHEKAIFIIRSAGIESFKGSGYVRGGLFDRVQVRQGDDAFTFRDLDYLNLYGLEAAGAPAFNESAIFIIRSKAFSAAWPWKLSFLGNRVDRATGARTFASFDAAYWLPADALEGGRPKVETADAAWVQVWKTRAVEIALFAALLIAVAVVYALRDQLTQRSTHKNKWPVNGFKYSAWLLSLVFVGFGAMAQPSITQVLTWFHALLFQWQWTLFLSDPFIFLFWVFIIVTVFVFGRGLFCGWLCPFGSLQEIVHKVAGAVGLKRFQFKLRPRWHDRLKWVKYALFFGLLVVSMFSMGLAEVLSEVEPFKTTFLVGITNRAWPYGLFVAAILGLSIFIERPYCKYICPLGGALAMPSTFRWSGLRRKPDCNRCKACAVGCGSQAIDVHGRIDHRECLHCLDCMVLYTDVTACPPLAKERKQRERAGQPLTAITRSGYFIPIIAVAADGSALTKPVPAAETGALRGGVDPRLPTPPVTPPYAAGRGIAAWLLGELRDHLWPWSRAGWAHHRALQAAGIALAAAATAAWLLAADGRLSQVAVIAWWFGWSLYEVLIRLQGKRHVKDGPWWGRTWREANVMDMLSYVGFKNLLIGATLFLGLRALGLLQG